MTHKPYKMTFKSNFMPATDNLGNKVPKEDLEVFAEAFRKKDTIPIRDPENNTYEAKVGLVEVTDSGVMVTLTMPATMDALLSPASPSLSMGSTIDPSLKD